MMKRSAVLRTVGVRGVSLLATFLLSVSAARSLGPEDAGSFFLVFTLLALLATGGRFGTDNLALRLLGGDTASPRSDILQLLLIASAASFFAGILGVLIIPRFVGDDVGIVTVVLVASCILAQALAVVAGTILRGLGNLASGVFAELGSLPAIATVMISGHDLLMSGEVTVESALWALTVAAWMTAGWSVPLAVLGVRKRLVDAGPRRPVRGLRFFGEHWRKLAPMMGTSLLAYGVVWAPLFVLSVTSSMVEVSYYSVALRIANMVALLPTIQVSYLAPEFARRFYAHDLDGLNSLASRATMQVAAITFVPLLLVVSFSQPIVRLLYGEDFVDAAPTMAILSIGVFLVLLCGQVNQLMLLCGLESVALALTSLALVLWVTLGAWVGSQYGSLGVAWVGGLISVLYALAAVIVLRRSRGIRSYAWVARRTQGTGKKSMSRMGQ